MELWIPVTIAAAFAQNLRFMLQKHLKTTQLSTAGATFSRFLYSAPLVALIVAVYMQLRGLDLPGFAPVFWVYAVVGGLGQISGTLCVVALFVRRNFAVGITFKNTEVILAAVVGLIVLGEGLSLAGVMAILLGFVGLGFLSDAAGSGDPPLRRLFSGASGLGLLSGLSFAISAVSYRGASLALVAGDVFLRASVTLAVVTAFQTLVLTLWLGLRESGEIRRVLAAWPVAVPMGLASLVGSLCWFTAFILQTAAYVKALGQVELLFSIIASYLFYRERITAREWLGMAVLMASIMLLILLI